MNPFFVKTYSGQHNYLLYNISELEISILKTVAGIVFTDMQAAADVNKHTNSVSENRPNFKCRPT